MSGTPLEVIDGMLQSWSIHAMLVRGVQEIRFFTPSIRGEGNHDLIYGPIGLSVPI